tara:strand:- start:541 stop:1770 length:1230 start_codon:yes stop_codon:yes gene_type:complete
MAVDQTLIQGAYAARQPIGVPASRFATQLSKTATDAFTTFVATESAKLKQEEELRKKAESILLEQSYKLIETFDMTPAEAKDYLKAINLNKEKFLDPDVSEMEKQDILMNTADLGLLKSDFEELKLSTAENLDLGGEISGWFKNLDNEESEILYFLTNKDSKINIDQENPQESYVTINVGGENKNFTLLELQQIVNNNKFDKGFQKDINTINQFFIEASANFTQDQQPKYNRGLSESMIKTALARQGVNLQSVATDAMMGGNKTYIETRKKNLIGTQYSDLLGPETKEKYDVDGDGKIDAKEAKNIVNALLQKENESYLRDELVGYFADEIFTQGYNVGTGSRVIKKDEGFIGLIENSKEFKAQFINFMSLSDMPTNASAEELEKELEARRVFLNQLLTPDVVNKILPQ